MFIPQPCPRTPQQSFQVMSIQHQQMYSTYIYSQNCLQHISNTNIYLKYIYSPTETTQPASSRDVLHWIRKTSISKSAVQILVYYSRRY